MGVLGLWQIIDSVGHPIKLEGLEGKQLGVDANLWLYKFIRGFREKDNAANLDAHKLGLFNRISKLLFYKIKPIFVFDGPAPILKRRTLERRKDIRNKEYSKVQSSAIKLLSEQLKAQYPDVDIEQLKIRLPNLRSHNLVLAEKLTDEDRELFYLPPEDKNAIDDSESDEDYISIPSQLTQNSNQLLTKQKISNDTVYIIDSDDDCDDNYLEKDIKPSLKMKNEFQIDINSEEFEALPPEIRYEMLQEIKEEKRRIKRASAMPEDAESFSNFQLNRLKSKRLIQEKIEKCEKDIQFNFTGEVAGSSVQSYRVQSDATSTMLYGKKVSTSPSNDIKDDKKNEENSSVKESKEESREESAEPRKHDEVLLNQVHYNKVTTRITDEAKELLTSKSSKESTDEDRELFYLPPEDKNAIDDSESDEDYISIPSQLTQNSNNESTQQKISNDTIHIIDSDEDCNQEKDTEPSLNMENKSQIDINSKEFEGLHSEIRHDLLQEIKEQDERVNSSPAISQDAESFSKVTTRIIDEAKELLTPNLNKESTQQKMFNDTVHIIDSDEDCDDDYLEKDKKPSSKMKNEFQIDINSQESETSCAEVQHEMLQEIKEQGKKINIPSRMPEDAKSFSKEEESTKPNKHNEVLFNHVPYEVAKNSRTTSKVTTRIIDEAKELLKLFGVPFIDAPGEAEAQLALLEQLKLTEGTITDDSDVWLFGAQNVYRHFFSDDKYVLQYKMSEIDFHIRMNRANLICFAMLVGSDYTDGIMNVGPVTALEILSEFPGDNLEPLIKFKNWRDQYNKTKRGRIPGSKKRETFLKFTLPDEFPSRTVFEGYTRPFADTSTEKFQWGIPELDELREYARRNFGWDTKKIDDKLLPVMKKVNERKTQPTIDSFFFKRAATQNPELFRSKRINKALNKIQVTKTSGSQEKKQKEEEIVVLTASEESDDNSEKGDDSVSPRKKQKLARTNNNPIRTRQKTTRKQTAGTKTKQSETNTTAKETKKRRVNKGQ